MWDEKHPQGSTTASTARRIERLEEVVGQVTGLKSFFESSHRVSSTHSWILAEHDPEASSPRNALAAILASLIVKHRCRGCPQYYQAWKLHVDGGPEVAGSARKALEAFIGSVVGLPDRPDLVPIDHLEGFVSEMVWYFICQELPTEPIVRIEPPGFRPTDSGGDGLVIHRVPDEYLMFRLWEIKKFVKRDEEVSTSVSSTVSRAYAQLDARATEYLARHTAIGQELPDPELAEFYSRLIEYWIDATPEAAAGVSVAISLDQIPRTCFSTFGRRFPRFVEPVRLRGLLTAIGDLSDFALQVRDQVWKGL
jgi:hypothetical protein